MKKETSSGNAIYIPHNLFFILRGRNGFTLLEVLISLAVIGALLIPLIYTLNYHLSLVERQEKITTATLLAKNKIADMAKHPEESKGSFDSPYETYSYETAVKDSPYVGIAEVVVVVKNGNEEITLHEFVFR